MRWREVVGSLLLLAAAAPAAAQLVGEEIVIGPGRAVNVAGQPSGFVVVWDSADGIQGRRFSADGASLGNAFIISPGSGNSVEGRTSVRTAADGSFVVAWEAQPVSGSSTVRARRYDAGATPLGPEFQVNTSTTGFHREPSVAVAPDGAFVVAWQANTSIWDVYARRFDAGGAPLGGQFLVNTVTTFNQSGVSVYAAPDGGFAAFWFGLHDNLDVHARRYDAAGQPGPAFVANSYVTGTQNAAVALYDPSGSFTVAWAGPGPTDQNGGIFAQRFDAAGAPVGSELRLNGNTANHQELPDVARERNGRFAAVWRNRDLDSVASRGVFTRLLDAQGQPLGAEFKLTNDGDAPAAAADGGGQVLVAWDSGPGVRGRVLFGLRPLSVAADVGGNGVADPDEAAALAPDWLNTTGAAVALTGALTAFTGPAGGAYTIVDGTADYGTLADAAHGSCAADCYVLRASAAARPLLHWDASVTETLSTGHFTTYAYHLGDSFSDVPRSSPFYRGVETMLHRGVTAGCGSGAYCPTAPVTREQMAVFALTGREGPGYAPLQCFTPRFEDVPAGSPFCRWIEELAKRQVVGGCGPTTYCPADFVTREQMPVFVLRTLDQGLQPPACATPVFADVPASSPFCPWIEELARRGVVAGCGGGNYCPGLPVTREQMGVFIADTFGLTLYGP
jgi:hypothetical protein